MRSIRVSLSLNYHPDNEACFRPDSYPGRAAGRATHAESRITPLCGKIFELFGTALVKKEDKPSLFDRIPHVSLQSLNIREHHPRLDCLASFGVRPRDVLVGPRHLVPNRYIPIPLD